MESTKKKKKKKKKKSVCVWKNLEWKGRRLFSSLELKKGKEKKREEVCYSVSFNASSQAERGYGILYFQFKIQQSIFYIRHLYSVIFFFFAFVFCSSLYASYFHVLGSNFLHLEKRRTTAGWLFFVTIFSFLKKERDEFLKEREIEREWESCVCCCCCFLGCYRCF